MSAFVTIIFILGIVTVYAIHSFRPNPLTGRYDEDFVEKTFEPKRLNRLEIWWCKRNNHTGNAHHVIESNNGTHKVRCIGCNTIFLEGKKVDKVKDLVIY